MEVDYQGIIIALAKLAIFAVFITAIIEVIKTVAAKGVWNMVWELVQSLWSNSPLSESSVKLLNFVIALIYCKIFNYGVMTNVLQIDFKENAMAFLLDYIGTASLVFMGASWAFDQLMAVKAKYTTGSKDSIPEKENQ